MNLNYNEIVDLLNGSDDNWLFEEANKYRKHVYGNKVFLGGIIETSNICKNSCSYCGLNAGIKRERSTLNSNKIVETVKKAIELEDIKTFTFQGGENNSPSNIKLIESIVFIAILINLNI